MSLARKLAAGILLGTGIVHAVQFAGSSREGIELVKLAFGLGYLAIGLGLLGRSRRMLKWGIGLPGLGGTLALAGVGISGIVHHLGLFLIGLDFLVALLCWRALSARSR